MIRPLTFSNLANTFDVMDIPGYISGLLFDHDCVVVPGFGGFVASYSPAKVDGITHAFSPPSKKILFNPRLRSDDGLLHHYIAVSEKISYEEASVLLSHRVRSWHRDLENGQRVIIHKVGVIRPGSNGSIGFEQDPSVNYLSQSFGLTGFTSPPVDRRAMGRKIEKKFTDRKPRPVRKLPYGKIYRAAAIVLPAAILISWLLISGGGGLLDRPVQTGLIPEKELMEKPTQQGPAQIHETAASVEKETREPAETIKNEPAPEPVYTGPAYHIIVGAFEFEANADRLVEHLLNSNYPARRAGRSSSGLHMVSAGIYPDRNDALRNLRLIRKEENPSAWLLRK